MTTQFKLPEQFALKLDGQDKYWDEEEGEWLSFTVDAMEESQYQTECIQEELQDKGWVCSVVRLRIIAELVEEE